MSAGATPVLLTVASTSPYTVHGMQQMLHRQLLNERIPHLQLTIQIPFGFLKGRAEGSINIKHNSCLQEAAKTDKADICKTRITYNESTEKGMTDSDWGDFPLDDSNYQAKILSIEVKTTLLGS